MKKNIKLLPIVLLTIFAFNSAVDVYGMDFPRKRKHSPEKDEFANEEREPIYVHIVGTDLFNQESLINQESPILTEIRDRLSFIEQELEGRPYEEEPPEEIIIEEEQQPEVSYNIEIYELIKRFSDNNGRTRRKRFPSTNLKGADLSRFFLVKTTLTESYFEGANLREANLSEATINRGIFRSSNLY